MSFGKWQTNRRYSDYLVEVASHMGCLPDLERALQETSHPIQVIFLHDETISIHDAVPTEMSC